MCSQRFLVTKLNDIVRSKPYDIWHWGKFTIFACNKTQGMSYKKEIDDCLKIIQSLMDSFQAGKEKETLYLSFFSESYDRIDHLKSQLKHLEMLQNTNGDSGNSMIKKTEVDIRSFLTLNDRFRFQRDLFNADSELMNQTFSELNSLDSMPEVLNYLNGRFSWDWDDESVLAFKDLLDKRFSSEQ